MLVDTSPAPASLDLTERTRLQRLERTVDRAVEVAGKIAGDALATIRDERLYRVTHTTFEDYVQARWGFSKSTAYRMIDAATAPEPRQVEGSSHAGTNPRPAAEPDDVDDEPVTMPPAAARAWADVEVVDPLAVGRLVLRLDPLTELPAAGARVLLAWER